MPYNADGKFVNAGGDPPAGSALQALCEVYDDAYDEWEKKPKPRPPFNDTLVSKVKDPSMRDALEKTQERAVGFIEKGTGAVQSLSDLSKSGGDIGKQAKHLMGKLAGRLRDGANLSRFRMGGSSMVRGSANGMGDHFKVKKALHPDFCHPGSTTPGGRPIEVKRPGEPESHDGQKSNYAKCDPNSPKQCDAIPEDCGSTSKHSAKAAAAAAS